jgi:hypothetical protein
VFNNVKRKIVRYLIYLDGKIFFGQLLFGHF